MKHFLINRSPTEFCDDGATKKDIKDLQRRVRLYEKYADPPEVIIAQCEKRIREAVASNNQKYIKKLLILRQQQINRKNGLIYLF